MTYPTRNGRRRAPLPAGAIALAALALAGCSATHVGDAWQCPLAQGAACESVAGADPAVPDVETARTVVLQEPLYRARGAEDAAPVSARRCEDDCSGFDPLAWLAQLFAVDDNDPETPSPGQMPPATETAVPAATSSTPPPSPESHHGDAIPDSDAAGGERPAEDLPAPEAAALPAEPDPADLRTGEVVARIWIAPFVDGDGVYREASHVRVVLEPAAWRLR